MLFEYNIPENETDAYFVTAEDIAQLIEIKVVNTKASEPSSSNVYYATRHSTHRVEAHIVIILGR